MNSIGRRSRRAVALSLGLVLLSFDPARAYDSGEFLQVQDYKHVQRWTETIAMRPAVKRGRMVNRTWGQPASQLHERHEASDFETVTQDKVAPAAG